MVRTLFEFHTLFKDFRDGVAKVRNEQVIATAHTKNREHENMEDMSSIPEIQFDTAGIFLLVLQNLMIDWFHDVGKSRSGEV